MIHQILAVLPPEWEDWLFDSSWAFQQASPGIVGLGWKSKKEWEAQLPPKLYIAFIDCMTGEIKHRDAYQWHGVDMEEIQLWSGIALDDWIVTWENLEVGNILLCPVHWSTPLASALPIILDTVTEMMTRMGPVIFVTATKQDIRVVHLQPLIDDTSPSLVHVSRVVKNRLGQLKRTGHLKSVLEYFWLGGTLRAKGVWDALKAGAMIKGRAWYLLTFNAQYNMDEEFVVDFPEIGFRNVVKGKPYWQMAISGGPLPVSIQTWKYPLHIKIPADSSPYASFMDDVIVGACLIAGPSRLLPQQKTQATIVVAVGLIKKEAIGLPDEQARPLCAGELLCISQHGQVVQECKEEIIEQVELCLVGETVIGVDRIQRRWRLWRWEPLAGKEQFTTIRWLDEEVVHAHVVTNHENSDPQGTHF